MTVWSGFPRRVPTAVAREERIVSFSIGDGVSLSALANWQSEPTTKPTVLIVHGLTGDARCGYSYGLAEKALAKGMNAVRLNLRGCGDNEETNAEIYHAGVSPDLRHVLENLKADGHREIYVVGMSLGGNVALKLAGELGDTASDLMRGVVAISPPIDLAASCDSLRSGGMNALYQYFFLRNLRRRVRLKHQFHPDRIPVEDIDEARTLWDFDDVFTSRLAGFGNADNYYAQASSLPLLGAIRLPTLLIHSRDDTFVPFASFETPLIHENPNLTLLATDAGGHGGFIGRKPSKTLSRSDSDGFWAENRALQFFESIAARAS
ncbi:MAG: putative alpha/beta-fold hydrolase [Planctomycetota bacterium]|jgi:predicted alpha/beta-fold hydrolase